MSTLPFVVGQTYRTQEGKLVTIIAENAKYPGYESVQGDDISPTSGEGVWRYQREGDRGRVCGSPHDWSDPRNIVPVSLLIERVSNPSSASN